jgi:Tfp pilus assembly protein PilO
MSQPVAENQRAIRTEQIRRQLSQIRSSRRQGMFGFAEIAGIAFSGLLVLLVLVSYFYFFVPANSRLASLQRERDRLQTLLRSAKDVMHKDEDTKTTVERLTSSMQDFEMKRLSQLTQGRMGLYDELNTLIARNGLRNSSGPTYTMLESLGSKNGKKATSTKWQSVYPGIAIAVTVEGPYQNLRHFVRDIENSKQFIIINAVELERATETNAPVSAEGAPASARGSLVSLRLDMATYFQRNLSDTEAAPGEQK